MKRIKYFVLFFSTLFILFSGATNVYAEEWTKPSIEHFIESYQKCAKGAISLDCGTGAQLEMTILAAAGSMGGLCSGPDCPQALQYEHSALAGLGNAVIAIMSHPVASTNYAVRDMGQQLGFLPQQAHAQGIGFSGLAPMLLLWKAFRNISYLLLAVILVVIGFMVMFRKKIDPKTVVTVQNSLPRIVIALILITFSYAIVGFMIDLMYLAIVLVVSLLSSAAPASSPFPASDFTGRIIGGGLSGLIGGFFGNFWGVFTSIYDLFTGGNQTIQVATPIVSGLLWGLISGSLKGAAVGGTIFSPPGILMLIIAIAMLFGFVRLVFLLIDAYINIVLSLITAPIQLMMEAVPGSNSFASWFKNLISKLAVFPITATLMLIAGILVSYDTTTTPLWAPPFLSNNNGTVGIGGLIGLGMLLIVPNIAGAIQKALKAEPAIPGGIAPILGPVGSGLGQAAQLIYQASFVGSMIRHKPDARTPLQVVREGGEKGIGGITGGGGH